MQNTTLQKWTQRQAGVAIIEYIVLGSVLVLGLVFGVSSFRNSAQIALDSEGTEFVAVASGQSSAEKYSEGGGQAAPGGGQAAPGGGQAAPGGAAEPIEFGNGLKDEDRGNHFVRGPHGEVRITDADGDGTLDTIDEHGSLGHGHSQGNWKGLIGYDLNGDLVYADGSASAHYDTGGSGHLEGEAGLARTKFGINVGSNEAPRFRIEAEVKLLSAEALGSLLLGDDGRRVGYGSNAKAAASVLDGRIGIVREIDIPFTNKSLKYKAGVGAGLASAGANAGGGAFYDRADARYHLTGNLGIDEILGVGLDVDLSLGKRTPVGNKK